MPNRRRTQQVNQHLTRHLVPLVSRQVNPLCNQLQSQLGNQYLSRPLFPPHNRLLIPQCNRHLDPLHSQVLNRQLHQLRNRREFQVPTQPHNLQAFLAVIRFLNQPLNRRDSRLENQVRNQFCAQRLSPLDNQLAFQVRNLQANLVEHRLDNHLLDQHANHPLNQVADQLVRHFISLSFSCGKLTFFVLILAQPSTQPSAQPTTNPTTFDSPRYFTCDNTLTCQTNSFENCGYFTGNIILECVKNSPHCLLNVVDFFIGPNTNLTVNGTCPLIVLASGDVNIYGQSAIFVSQFDHASGFINFLPCSFNLGKKCEYYRKSIHHGSR